MRQLRNCTTGEIVAQRVSSPRAPWERAVGFLRRRRVDPAEGLWFERCGAVHTLGMRALIDVVFVDRDAMVVRIVAPAGRNRVIAGGPSAAATVELAAGIVAGRIRVGDRLRLE